MSLWGGRFEGKASPLFKRFNDSLLFDARLVQADITGSKAWAAALHRAGVLTADELSRLSAALSTLAEQAAADPSRVTTSGHEDVHSWVEASLIAAVGDLGKKLHTGRSRNDQVATDLRLFTADALLEISRAVHAVQTSLVNLAEKNLDTAIPGYTHMQRGQPVLFSHWALAYFNMLARDAQRFADARRRTLVSPLGSGALAGTAFPIDRVALAADLGFSGPSANSLDAVSDRDFVFETLSACTLCSAHLTRLAEDLILYCSSEFAFVSFDDAVTSGSSLMPQKKNPDALELIRGKMGRILGSLVSLAATLKGLPLAYNKDLQEDKEPLFDATDNLLLCLSMLCPVLDTMTVHADTCRAAALGDGTVLSTDLADYLVDKGVPFRTAHEVAGRLVRLALQTRTPLHKLPLAEMQKLDHHIGPDVFQALTLEASLARRNVEGGTAPNRVRQAIAAARVSLAD